MNEFVDRVGPVRLWVAVVIAAATALVVGIVAFPQRVYVDFLWQYYWGPVVADAHSWSCVAWDGGAVVECGPETTGPTASPGYTVVSYAGYVPTLLLLLVGIVFLIRRYDVDRYRAGFFALFPFMLFGGALRVVEDANATAFARTGELAIPMPYSGLLISPLIYFTVFFVALAAAALAVAADRKGYAEGYEYPLAGIGATLLLVTLAYLGYVAATEPYSTFHPLIPLVILAGATAVTAVTWWAIETYAPETNDGTRYMGIVVIWAHAVDGVANVVGLDWATALGLSANLVPKHPINAAIVDYTGRLLPADVVAVTGDAWPFLLVKIAAAVLIVRVFDARFFEESPRLAYLLMLTVVAVGLGPGTRDMLRATFGV